MITVEEVFENVSPEYMKIILGFLECDAEEVSIGYEIFRGLQEFNDEEIWDIPSEVEVLLEIEHLHSKTFSWGTVTLGVCRKRKVVIEQNASPLMLYWKST
jgi:hypothetical protein